MRLIGRSFKYHRPRGIVCAGADEPNALVQLETGARTDPNLRSTQIELAGAHRAHPLREHLHRLRDAFGDKQSEPGRAHENQQRDGQEERQVEALERALQHA